MPDSSKQKPEVEPQAVEQDVVVAKKKPGERQMERYAQLKPLLKRVEQSFPTLARDLRQADIATEPTAFIMSTFFVSAGAGVMVWLSLIVLSPMIGIPFLLLLPLLPVIVLVLFLWLMHYPKVKMGQKERDLDRDVLFAGRDMTISLKAGLPLFNAMVNVSKNYGVASQEFSKIVERIQSGVPADVALQEASEGNTSRRFHQILFQMIAAIRSGSDVATGLEVLLDQISREQVIALKKYGQQLNPITMFYLLFGVILPSIGITVGIILTSFVPVTLDASKLIIVIAILGMMQFAFLSFARSARPNFEV